MNEQTYNVTYGCGCVHEIEALAFMHTPTGNNKDCEEHKKVEEDE